MGLLLVIAISIIFIALCVAMAKKRRRNVMLWGILGAFFGPIPVVILALIGTRN